jgi:AAA+ ATPase superfamily predicted ATPase
VITEGNPFSYGRPLRRSEELVDRERELAALRADVGVAQPVMIYAPRRYGKTSLARVLSAQLAEGAHPIPTVYVDFWGATSISDIVDVLGRAYVAASASERTRRFLTDLLDSLGFSLSLGGAVSLSRSSRAIHSDERAALRDLLEVPRRLASRSPSGKLLMVLDEFGEVLTVPGEPDALMRSAFQASPDVSFLFMGSKRSLMEALFTDRHRPFYNFGRRMELGRLPTEDLGAFMEDRFHRAGRKITAEAVDLLLRLVDGHPYRAQQFGFHTFELVPSGGWADEETVLAARDVALDETAAEFRAILDGMTPARRAVYLAVCREPSAEMHARPYLRRHGIRSSGSLDSALQALAATGDLETARGRVPAPTDPLLALWVRERLAAGVEGG